MKNLRIALIGAGGIGRLWAKAIKKVKGVSLSAVVDVNRSAAETIAQEFPDCLIETDWRKIISIDDIDAVLAAAPHKFLAPIAQAALKNRKHVLCEKPAGISSAEIKKNIELARKNRLIYMIGFNHRYHPAFLTAKKFFDAGKIGKIMFIRARYGFGGRPGYEKEWRFNKKISGGGELLDQGVHLIDLSRLFLGGLAEVKGFAEKLFWRSAGVEDNGFALLRGKNGGIASIHASWTNWNWIHTFEIFGEKGYLIIEGLDQRYRGPERLIIGMRHPKFLKPPEEKTLVFTNEQKEFSLERELRDFAAAIQGRKNSIPDGRDAYEALKVVEKIYKP
jgi:predicted dehydrogenase